jgi:hypothetical protein
VELAPPDVNCEAETSTGELSSLVTIFLGLLSGKSPWFLGLFPFQCAGPGRTLNFRLGDRNIGNLNETG